MAQDPIDPTTKNDTPDGGKGKSFYVKIPVAGFVTVILDSDLTAEQIAAEDLDEDEIHAQAIEQAWKMVQEDTLDIHYSIHGKNVEEWNLETFEKIVEGNVVLVDCYEIEVEDL